MSFIEARNLSYTYKSNTHVNLPAVNDVSFTAEKGEIIGIVGHTGSGKSTLVQMLNGLIRPESGQVFIDGRDIWKDFRDIREVHFKIGLVFQYPEQQLFEESVFKDIAFGPKNHGLSDNDIERRVYESAEFVGLEPSLLNRSPLDLSGGERRKAAIAGVIAMNPDVLILDEPTAGLDPLGRKRLIDSLKNYHKERGNVTIAISHNMDEVAETADRVIVMDKGKIKFFGKSSEIFLREKELLECGLKAPSITKIMSLIYGAGYKVNKSIVTVSQGEEEINRILKRKIGE